MNAKTKEAVERHGRQLLAIFPNCTERDPVALCRKVRRIETVAGKLAEDCCNFLSMESPEFDVRYNLIQKRLSKLLHGKEFAFGQGITPFMINLDPRGYALKINDQIMRDQGLDLHRDFGGYGIIAPDLTAK